MSVACLITQSAHGLDQRRVLWIVLELLTQALDVDRYRVVVDEILVHIPDAAQDLAAGEHSSLVDNQREQQPIFQRGEKNFASVFIGLGLLGEDRHVSTGDGAITGFDRSPTS